MEEQLPVELDNLKAKEWTANAINAESLNFKKTTSSDTNSNVNAEPELHQNSNLDNDLLREFWCLQNKDFWLKRSFKDADIEKLVDWFEQKSWILKKKSSCNWEEEDFELSVENIIESGGYFKSIDLINEVWIQPLDKAEYDTIEVEMEKND